MVVMDSDILIGILRGDEVAVKFMESTESRGESLNTTAINACELFEGALLHTRMEESIIKVRTLLGSFEILSFTSDASLIAAEILVGLRKKGAMIDLEDIYIAAIAKLNGEGIATRNTEHFGRITGIKIRKW